MAQDLNVRLCVTVEAKQKNIFSKARVLRSSTEEPIYNFTGSQTVEIHWIWLVCSTGEFIIPTWFILKWNGYQFNTYNVIPKAIFVSAYSPNGWSFSVFSSVKRVSQNPAEKYSFLLTSRIAMTYINCPCLVALLILTWFIEIDVMDNVF